jgi:transposase
VMVLDGTGWHQSASLRLAHNLRLLTLPPYPPELNPVEHTPMSHVRPLRGLFTLLILRRQFGVRQR